MPPIVDAHVHLWNPTVMPLPWLAGNRLLDQRYDLGVYDQQTAGIDIGAIVYVQVEVKPAYGLLEARWVAEHSRDDPRVQAIVAWAPVEDGLRVRSYLDALVAIDPRIRGIRRLIQTEADPAFCLSREFVAAVQLLPEYGLSFDLGINADQLEAAAELVRRCPGTQFILDHMAKPPIAAAQLEPWQEQLHALAALPNVMCKISGLITAADRSRWTANDLAPYVAAGRAAFGADRIVFASDWPVMLQAGSYRQWFAALEALTSDWPAEERHMLWSQNATRFYRLDPPTSNRKAGTT